LSDSFAAHIAGTLDLDAAAHLLYQFNRESGEPTPPPAVLADRLRQLIEGGDTAVLGMGDSPLGVAVLRLVDCASSSADDRALWAVQAVAYLGWG
jgi:hypothetical protein